MRGQLSQRLLDDLATAWSRLDHARPRDRTEVAPLLDALDEWLQRAVSVDGELLAALGDRYAASRETGAGGRPLPGLHLAAELSRRHAIDALVTVSAGTPDVLYDVVWKRYEELPLSDPRAAGGEAYRLHLAGQAARRPASDVTTFLLTAAAAEVSS